MLQQLISLFSILKIKNFRLYVSTFMCGSSIETKATDGFWFWTEKHLVPLPGPGHTGFI